MNLTVLFQIQSALILALMIFGVTKRRVRKVHVRTMLTAIVWDILLVLQIELSRSAIDTASKGLTNPTPLLIHLFFALSSVLLYFVMIWSGNKILQGDNSRRGLHGILGWITLTFRTLTLITSFWAAAPKV